MYRTLKLGLLTALPVAVLAFSAAAQTAPGTTDTHPSLFQHMLQKMDANGDGRISEQEFLAAASARFAALDTQHTGSINAQEMLSSPLATERLQKRADAMVRRLDKAGAGYITQAEVVAAAQKSFARMDKNGDGKLTPDELTSRFGHRAQTADPAANPQAGARRAAFVQQRFDKLDTNHDGVVTQDEFVAAAVARFQQADVQGTGQVTAAEIAGSPQAQARAQHAVAHIIKRLDTNGDGVVSQDEFLAAAKKRFSRMDKNGDGYIDADEVPGHRWAHGGNPVKVDG